jgi:hypothetical protein
MTKIGHCVVYPSVFWSLCCLSFCLLVIVLSFLLSVGHCVMYPSVFWSLCCLSFCLFVILLFILLSRRLDNTMTKRQKDRQHKDQKTEGYITQWPTDRRINNRMTNRQKDRQHNDCLSFCHLVIVLSILSFGHCVVYLSVFWSDRQDNDQLTEG